MFGKTNNYKKRPLSLHITAAMPLFVLAGFNAHAAQQHQHEVAVKANDGDVITVTAPLYSPMTRKPLASQCLPATVRII
ncbi:Uncharacterised protein [Serratia liquefaciens]|nr:Uncharacterised protein [Serratia liquefaciens]